MSGSAPTRGSSKAAHGSTAATKPGGKAERSKCNTLHHRLCRSPKRTEAEKERRLAELKAQMELIAQEAEDSSTAEGDSSSDDDESSSEEEEETDGEEGSADETGRKGGEKGKVSIRLRVA